MTFREIDVRQFVAFMLVAVVCSASSVLAQSDYARVSGQVVGEDGKPVAGLKIRFVPAGGSSAPEFEVTTNKKGKFVRPNAAPGTFEPVVEEGWRISKIAMKQLGATIAAGGEFEAELAPGEPAPPLSWLVQSQIRLSVTVSSDDVAGATGYTDAGLAALEDASPILKELNDLFEAQDWSTLIDRSAEVLAEKPDLGGAHYLRGVALLRADRAVEAIDSMRLAAELMPDQPGIKGTLATILLTHAAGLREQGEEDAALDTYAEAADLFAQQLEDTPDSVVYLTNRVAALDLAGNTEELAPAIEALLAVDDSNTNATLRLAELYIEQGRVDDGLAILAEMGDQSDAAATLIYNAAVEMWNAGDLGLTVATVDKGLALAPEMADLYRLKAMALISDDQPQAIALLDKYLSMVPEDTPGIEADKQLLQALRERQ